MAVGYSAFSIKDKFVWCGSAIRSKEDGKYYLFYSAMDSGENCPPFIDSWVLGSKIGVAVSDSPYGGYKDLGIFTIKMGIFQIILLGMHRLFTILILNISMVNIICIISELLIRGRMLM